MKKAIYAGALFGAFYAGWELCRKNALNNLTKALPMISDTMFDVVLKVERGEITEEEARRIALEAAQKVKEVLRSSSHN